MLTAHKDNTRVDSNVGSRPISVRVENVFKRYGKASASSTGRGVGRTWALNDISFEVSRGEMFGLLGPNGAGKTTLLKSIATLLQVSSGRIVAEGVDVSKQAMQARRMMGLVTCDERSFYWRLSARENLKFFGALYQVPKRELSERIENLLTALDLADAASRPYHSFSTGMRQKMAVARGLLTDPRLVLYDEPTRSLDPVSTQRIREWVRESRRRSPEKTHIIATNQLSEAEQLCDRVLIINGGQIVAQGSVADIRARFGETGQRVHRIFCTGFSLHMLREPDPEAGLWALEVESTEGEVTVVRAETSAEGAGLSIALESILSSGGRILKCETERPSFDEVFQRIIQGDQQGDQAREESAAGVRS